MLFYFLLATATPDAPAPIPDLECDYNLEEMLSLDRHDFDQSMDGGWRTLAAKEGCEIAAAELIRQWRHINRDHNSILYWHEGQMRAFGGQATEAIALFRLTYAAPEKDADFGWNYYVSGSIAFLTEDRAGLREAIQGLKSIPEPQNNSFTRPDGTVIELDWPPNLDVLEAFDRCWGKSYTEAYSSTQCREATP